MMMDLVFVFALDNFTGHGQITLNATQGQVPKQVPEVINVIEDDSVTFRCQTFPTLFIRLPESLTFASTLPPNLRRIDSLTFEFVNVS